MSLPGLSLFWEKWNRIRKTEKLIKMKLFTATSHVHTLHSIFKVPQGKLETDEHTYGKNYFLHFSRDTCVLLLLLRFNWRWNKSNPFTFCTASICVSSTTLVYKFHLISFHINYSWSHNLTHNPPSALLPANTINRINRIKLMWYWYKRIPFDWLVVMVVVLNVVSTMTITIDMGIKWGR